MPSFRTMTYCGAAAFGAVALLMSATGNASAQNVGEMPAALSEHTSDEAKVVWGGGAKKSSSYSSKMVPVTIDQLAAVRLAGYTWGGPSQGTLMNATKVTVNPTHIALGQADILSTLNGTQIPGTTWNYAFTVVQKDIADECLYLITKSPHYETWGHVLENAWDIQIATGGESSGSYGTLTRILQERYPSLQDAEVVNVRDINGDDKANTIDIVESVAKEETSFGFFVMRPDPNSKVFEVIDEHELTLVPVIDFDIEDLYRFKSLKIASGGIISSARYHETACTQVQLITGDPEMLSEEQSRSKRRLEATIKRVSDIDSEALKEEVVEQFTSWRDYLDSVKDISGDRLSALLDASKKKIEELAN